MSTGSEVAEVLGDLTPGGVDRDCLRPAGEVLVRTINAENAPFPDRQFDGQAEVITVPPATQGSSRTVRRERSPGVIRMRGPGPGVRSFDPNRGIPGRNTFGPWMWKFPCDS